MLELQVNVQIGVTPEVASLVSAILNRPAAVEAPAAAAPAAADPEPAQPKKPRKSQKAEAPADPAPAANPAPAEAPEATTEDMPDNVYFPQEEDVRTAMHVTRQRIEGEDYKDKPSDDRHRAVTETFKAISNDLSGQKKPSALPQELRQAFIDASKTIQMDVDGKLTYTVNKK